MYEARNLQRNNINHIFLSLFLVLVGGATCLEAGTRTTRATPTFSTANRLRGRRRRRKDKHYLIPALIFLTRGVAIRYKWTRLHSSEELQISYSCKSPVPNPQVGLLFSRTGLKEQQRTAPLLRPSWISHCFHIQQLGWQC